MAGIGAEFLRALKSIFGDNASGTRSSAGATSGFTRTRIVNGPAHLHRIWGAADPVTNAADTQAFWSLDDSATSASGSAGAAIIGQFIGETTGSSMVSNQPFLETFIPPIPFDTGLTFNYTATGTGTGLRYSLWYSLRRTDGIF